MDHFYITLFSDTSTEQYPDNKPSHFTTQLSRQMNLTGKWEVGLSEVQHPIMIDNVRKGLNTIVLYHFELGREYITVEIEPGHYDNVETLVDTINSKIEPFQFFKLTYEKSTKTVIGDCKKGGYFTLRGDIARICGFKETTIIHSYRRGDYLALPRNGQHSFFVFCNHVESQHFCDKELPLLRSVTQLGKHGEYANHVFHNIQYLPVVGRHFHTISVWLKDMNSEYLSFHDGTVIVKLHFRKVSKDTV